MLQNLPLAPRVRAPRFDLDQELFVASKTIGTAFSYKMSTHNISKSGMLLCWDHTTPVPFSENTILEMTIDPNSRVLEKPVACLGKVVRKIVKRDDGQPQTQFGIRIVQIDHTDLDSWELCIEDLAVRTNNKVSDSSLFLGEAEADEEDEKFTAKKKYRHVA